MYKVLLCSCTYPPDKNGLSHVVYEHARRLSIKGYKVSIATSYAQNRETNYPEDFIKVYQFRINGQGRIGSRLKGEIDNYISLLSSDSFDIIIFHAWQCWSTELAVKYIDKIKAKKVLVSHGTSFSYLPFSLKGLIRWLSWRFYSINFVNSMNTFDHYVFLTDKADNVRFKDKLISNNLNLKNFSIIPNAGDQGLRQQPKHNFKYNFSIFDDLIFLSVANYSAEKNQASVLQAFKTANIQNATLVFIGSYFNDYSKKLLKIIAGDHFLQNKVILLEKQSKEMIQSAYIASDIFLSASVTEAQPLMILDAMAAGVPFISSNVGCIAEFPGGIVVNSQKEMAFQMIRLANDLQLRKNLSIDAIKAYNIKYNWHSSINLYHELLTSLMISRQQ